MLSVTEAQQKILQGDKSAVLVSEKVVLDAALKRILAEDILAPISVPSWDNSAMDGYALHTDHLLLDRPLTVSQIITAGAEAKILSSGDVARIFTGAPIPDGANAVEMQENVECCDEGDGSARVVFKKCPQPGQNIRRRGEDIQQHDVLLEQGCLLEPVHLGLLASVGISHVSVYKKITVALLSTGDELTDVGQSLQAGKIYNSNQYFLRGLLEALGCNVISAGKVEDDFQATVKCLTELAGQADVVITSGGVSVGDEDHVKNALASIGHLNLWKIAVKPGKPLAFGAISKVKSVDGRNATFFGLPGNPVSAFVTFLLFVKPHLLKRQGLLQYLPKAWMVTAGFDWPLSASVKVGSREEYLRVRLNYETQVVSLFSHQGSGVLSSLVWADGLVKIPAGQRISAGDTLSFLAF